MMVLKMGMYKIKATFGIPFSIEGLQNLYHDYGDVSITVSDVVSASQLKLSIHYD